MLGNILGSFEKGHLLSKTAVATFGKKSFGYFFPTSGRTGGKSKTFFLNVPKVMLCR